MNRDDVVAWKFRMDGVDQVMLDEDADVHVRRNGIPLYAAPLAAQSSGEQRAVELLRRIRQWDMLDVAADGPYWKREINAVLGDHHA